MVVTGEATSMEEWLSPGVGLVLQAGSVRDYIDGKWLCAPAPPRLV